MKSIMGQNPCVSCTADRQKGNPYYWQTPCHGCEKKRLWEKEKSARVETIEEVLGDDYDLDRLRQLIKADREGRCTVLPCKASDVTVYQLRNKKHALGPGVHPRHIYCATVWSGGRYQLEHQGFEPCRDKDFGKTWFLDEDAAKEALKGGPNDA